jgi:hypothetical protein
MRFLSVQGSTSPLKLLPRGTNAVKDERAVAKWVPVRREFFDDDEDDWPGYQTASNADGARFHFRPYTWMRFVSPC